MLYFVVPNGQVLLLLECTGTYTAVQVLVCILGSAQVDRPISCVHLLLEISLVNGAHFTNGCGTVTKTNPFSLALSAFLLQLVPYAVVVRFTLIQLVYLLGVWALTTWAGIAGIAFPLPIMALVPIRQFLLPRLFDRGYLSQLDAAEYEEAPAVVDRLRAAQVSG